MTVILIVEDDALIRELSETVIQDWGYQTLSASGADEALLLLRSPEHIDLLFTEIFLRTSICNGCELEHQAIALRPQLRVLYVTENVVAAETNARLVTGARSHRKPYTLRQLQDAFKDLLAA